MERVAMERLRQRADFLAAAAAARAPAAGFVLQARSRKDEGPARIGFTVSRKVGTAVERNRARRRLREVVRRADADAIARGHDYVVVARRAAINLPFDRLMLDFSNALRRLSAPASAGRPGAKGSRSRQRSAAPGRHQPAPKDH